MHDSNVVAFTIPRPWPRRRTYEGGGLWWPSVITIWHVEPGGHDSGEICKHYHRVQDETGAWRTEFTHAWKWHVHHWRIQVHPLQRLRRWALTRCEWCRGRSRKGDEVNVSHQWDRDRGHWWQGERGLYHGDCSTISNAHMVCLCDVGPWEHETGGRPYGLCASCGKHRTWTKEPRQFGDQAQRLLATIPQGQRDPVKYAQAVALWARQREPVED